jgi:hypothetical protein
MRPRLVKDWHTCHKWLSMQFLAVSVALQGAFMVMPQEMRSALPDWATRASAIALLVCAVLGRLLDQGGSDGSTDRADDKRA